MSRDFARLITEAMEWADGYPYRCSWCHIPFYNHDALEEHELQHESEARKKRGVPPREEGDYGN